MPRYVVCPYGHPYIQTAGTLECPDCAYARRLAEREQNAAEWQKTILTYYHTLNSVNDPDGYARAHLMHLMENLGMVEEIL